MKNQLVGKGGITVQIIEDTVNPWGDRMRTAIAIYPRFIHAELLRHRPISHSVSSSRAIPIDRVIQHVSENPASPFNWGSDKAGMSAGEEVPDVKGAKYAWRRAAQGAMRHAQDLQSKGLHKQIVNRVLEPFQWIVEVITGTEFDNMLKLRIHGAAQPEIHELTLLLYKASQESIPRPIVHGEYHLPFIDQFQEHDNGVWKYKATGSDLYDESLHLSLDEAIKVSMSCCAQSSFRRNNSSLEKADDLTEVLLFSDPVHASPAEHIGTPFSEEEHDMRETCRLMMFKFFMLDTKMTLAQAHTKSDHVMYSGNLRGFTQHRKEIKNETFMGVFKADLVEEENRFNEG